MATAWEIEKAHRTASELRNNLDMRTPLGSAEGSGVSSHIRHDLNCRRSAANEQFLPPGPPGRKFFVPLTVARPHLNQGRPPCPFRGGGVKHIAHCRMMVMRTFDYSPFYRATLGLVLVFHLLDSV